MVQASASPEQAKGHIDAWENEIANDPEMRALLFQCGVKANLAGQLFVRAIEVPESQRSLANENSGAFLDLDMTEAIAYFEDRYPENSRDTHLILNSYVDEAEKGERRMARALANRARDHLAEAIKNGSTLEEFAAAVRTDAVNLGIEVPSHGYLQTVFRTQTGMAYGAGRFKQLTSPEVIAARPYVQYVTFGDSLVRPAHRKLEGTQWDSSSSAWHAIAPPNGINCRCSMVSITKEQFGGRLTKKIPQGAMPDEGFNGPPAE